MPSFPGSIVSLTNPTSGSAMNSGSGHADQHIKANDEIEAIETELGTNPSASFSTVGDRLNDIESDITALSAGGGLALITASSIANSGGSASQTGGKVTFTGVSSVSLNGCFSSTYDVYLILARYTCSSARGVLRWRASGTDATGGSDYTYMTFDTSGSAPTAVSVTGSNSAIFMGPGNSSNPWVLRGTVFDPGTATPTEFEYFAGTTAGVRTGHNHHSQSTAYDGFTLYPDSSTFTGTLRVYGYAK